MKIRNTTPFLFGPKVTSRRPPQPEMTLVLRAAFVLQPNQPLTPLEDQGALTADTFRPDDEERRGDILYPGDFADFKLNAEVMLRGTCHPPAGKPVTESMVRFQVGAWSKRLRVVGPRAWSDRRAGAIGSEPLTLGKTSLDYTRAFGGPNYPPNPAGRGFETDLLPSIEAPTHPLRTRSDRPLPAGFGPINPVWPQRASKVGKEYGPSYREKRAPFYAEDFDWTYFHAAPPDQQIKGYLRGDEEVVFEGLHPEAARFSVRLPGLRIRAWVKDVKARFREVGMRLDTLFADLEEEKLYLTWRGVDPVAEDDLADVATVLLASEPLDSEPLPVEGYRKELDAFEADPIGMAAAMPEGFMDLAERFALESAGEAAADEPEEGSIARIPKLIKSFLQRLDGATVAQVDEMMGNAAKTAAGDTLRASLLQATGAAAGGSAPPLIPLKPGSMPPIRLGPQMRAMVAQVEQVKKAAAESGQTVVGLDSIDAIVNNPQLRQIDPTYKPPSPDDPPPEEPGPGRNLSGQDFSGRDLRGVDLTGANLEDAIFTRANLRGVVFKGANMKYAVLYEADVTDATFDEADLTMAQMARIRAAGASFRGATLEQASFEQADLTDARLEGAKGEYVRFSRANLRGAKASGAKLDRSQLDEATLEQTDFSGASLVACHFSDARARGVVMTKATIARATFEGADLTGAILTHAKGDRSVWMRAKLDLADLRYAWMTGAHFAELSANRACFVEANLKEGRFYRASLQGSSFVRANLFGADFCKASLVGVQFAGANLYDAKFLGAARKDCDFSGANLKRSTLENRT
jgi:uncharacterized protein YjbI with pentapeptide repeats